MFTCDDSGNGNEMQYYKAQGVASSVGFYYCLIINREKQADWNFIKGNFMLLDELIT